MSQPVAFGIHAVGYIPKPVNRQELAAALQTAYTLHITRRREVISVRDGIQIAPVRAGILSQCGAGAESQSHERCQ